MIKIINRKRSLSDGSSCSVDASLAKMSCSKRVSFNNSISIDEVPSVLNAPDEEQSAYWYDVTELWCMKREFKRMVMTLARGEELPKDDNGDCILCRHEREMLKKAPTRRSLVVKTIESVLQVQEEQRARGGVNPVLLSEKCSQKSRENVKLALLNAKVLAKQQKQENSLMNGGSGGKKLGRVGMKTALSMLGRASSSSSMKPPKSLTTIPYSSSAPSKSKMNSSSLRRETSAITTSHRQGSLSKLLSWRRQGK